MGFSMGGWLAAEMVAAAGPVFSKLMLVGSVGIKPNVGEIADVFIITPAQVIDLLFHDPAQAPEYEQVFGQTPSPADNGDAGAQPGDGGARLLETLHARPEPAPPPGPG